MPRASPYPSRKRGAWPKGQSPGPRPCAAERRDRRSPLRPSLKRGPHQGPELGFLGLRIRSLTAASAFRHLVRSPCPAGPDIRLAHSVLWAAPTHVSTHVRTCARPSSTWRRGPARRPAPRPALSPGARGPGGGRKRRRTPGRERPLPPALPAVPSVVGHSFLCRGPRSQGVIAGPKAPVLEEVIKGVCWPVDSRAAPRQSEAPQPLPWPWSERSACLRVLEAAQRCTFDIVLCC